MASDELSQAPSPPVIHVRLDLKALTRSKAGSIAGPIWLQVGSVAFPEEHWSDFPVAIVGAWLQAALKIHAGADQQAVCYFLDGPFSFTIDQRSPTIWRIAFRDKLKIPQAEHDVHAQGFSGILAAAAGQLMDACQERGWSGRDLDVLKALHRQRRRG
jgi:hypothetical protein